MADINELFRILKKSDGSGEAPDLKQEGDATASSNEMPVLPAEDLAGNFQHIPLRDDGAAAPVNNIPVLPAMDLAGNLQYMPVRDEGQAAPDINVPVLPAKDAANNLQFLKVDAFGNLQVNADAGSPKDANGTAAGSPPSTFVAVATLTLVASKTYDDIDASASATAATYWKLEQTDDATVTVIADGITGPGAYTSKFVPTNLRKVSGATGTQNLKLSGKQLNGVSTDLHGTITAVEK